MDIEHILEMRNRSPFRPFNLHLTSGEVVPCKHPELMAVSREEATLSLYAAPSWHLIDSVQVANLTTELKGGKQQKAKPE